MDALSVLLERNAASKLTEPAPGKDDLQQIIKAALRVPDHARLRPWRFLLIEGEARHALGSLFSEATRNTRPDASQEVLQKAASKSLRAPLIIVVIAAPADNPKVPIIEQQLSAGCAAHNILLAAHALGFSGIWRTGSMAYNAVVREGLGLASHEEITGFIYLGTLSGDAKSLPEIDPDSFASYWKPTAK